MSFGSFLEPVLSRTWDPLVGQIRYLVKAKNNIDDMDRAMGDLKAQKRTVLKKIEDGKRTQQKSTDETERWLKKVGNVEAEVEANKERYEQRGCVLLGTCSLNCWSTYKASRKASQLHAYMATLKTETEGKDISQLLRTETIGRGQSMPTSAVPMGVLERNVAKVHSYLKDDTVGVIGIHGMGGVGKTTLLKEINNLVKREKSMGSECRQAFVVVSKECQLRTLQTRLAKSLGLHVSDSDNDNEAAIKIFNYLKEESFLLLLDDMWEAIDLDKVGIPDPRSRSQTNKMQKVVITTRSFDVCTRMGADKTIKVECLNEDDALALFYESVGAWIRDSSPNIKSVAEKVASECGGLPLALSVIGKAMRSKTTPDEWRKALTSLRKPQAGYVVDEGNEIFTRLEFSYRNLSNDRKQCFLFCSLWPEDYSISKDAIVAYCIGQGYVNDFDDVTEAWDIGNCLIEDLKRAGLLESSFKEGEVKMHDVLRDLALWIQSDYGKNPSKCLVKAGMGLSEAPRDPKIWAEAQVISLMENDIQELGPTCFHCPLLLRFTVQSHGSPLGRIYGSLGRIHHGFFQHMPALTFLDLSFTAIRELPPDIGELKMLQHLDLTWTEITCLPKEVGNLLKLRYLDLSYTFRLKDVPSGVISRLLQLQVLDVFECGEHGVIDRILLDLESSLQLGGSLKALSIVVRSCEQFQRLSKMPRIFTRRLGIRLRGLSPLNLTRNMWRHALMLGIYNCTDTRELIFDGAAVENDDCCPARRLNFEELYELEKIIWRGLRPTVFLPYLCKVRIIECHRLKNVSWVVQLPSLTELELSKCNGLEQVIGGAQAEEIQHLEATTFPSLTVLSLADLPELTCICGSAAIAFPALRSLYVRGCPKLKEFPFLSVDMNKLEDLMFDDESWKGLQEKPDIPAPKFSYRLVS